jgi:hypothetical protein
MPNGALAPGKVLPKFWVPTNGRTRSTGACSAAAAGLAWSRPARVAATVAATRNRRGMEEPPVNNVIVR